MSHRPSIVWITLESTRFDHTSLSEYRRDTTPRLAMVAAEPATRSFEQSVSHAVWTRPSSASILTGTYPSHHGTGIEHDTLPTHLPTVPELLGEVGYRTVGVSTNPHLTTATDLDRGFDDFRWLTRSTLVDAVPARTLLSYLLGLRRYSGGYTTDGAKHNTSYLVTEIAKDRLEAATSDGDPAFLYAHYGDPHHPYAPPIAYLDRFTEDLPMDGHEARDIALEMSENLHEHIADGCQFSDREWDAIEAMYDAAVAFTDEQVGNLIRWVRTTLDDAVVVVTGDHGELFGQAGLLAHKLVVHDDVCRVPMVVRGPTAVTDHDRENVQHIDLVRTILEEVGAETETLQGYDLRTETRPYGVVQRGGDRAEDHLERFRELNSEFDGSRYARGMVTALRADGFKYVVSRNEAALYDLPDESTDRSQDRPDVAARFSEAADRFLADQGTPLDSERGEAAVSEEMRTRLEELGYLTE